MMEETVNSIGVENGDSKQIKHESEKDESNKIIDYDAFDISASEPTNHSITMSRQVVTASKSIDVENNDSSVISQGHLSDHRTVSEEEIMSVNPPSDAMLTNLNQILNESSVCDKKAEQFNEPSAEPLSEQTNNFDTVSCEDSLNINLQKSAEVDSIAESNASDNNSNNLKNMNIEVDNNVELENSDVNLVNDDKLQNIESELSFLTGDNILPEVPGLQNGLGHTSADNENIISELSVIHGEHLDSTVNGDNQNLSFITISTDEIQKVYDKNAPVAAQETLMETLMTLVEGKPKNALPQEEVALNNLQLLAILEGGADSPSPLKEDNKTQLEVPVKKFRKTIKMDPELEKTLALNQLKKFPCRNKAKDKKKIEDVKIPRVFKSGATVGRPRKTPKIVSEPTLIDIPRRDVAVKTYSKKKSSNDISNLIDDWSDDDGGKDSMEPSRVTELSSQVGTPVPADVVKTPQSKDTEASSFIEPTPKRASRVIKKKVIYDPDNPDSYKFASSIIRKNYSDKKSEQDGNTKETASPVLQSNIIQVKSKILIPKIATSGEVNEPVAEAKITKKLSVPVVKKKILNASLSKKKKLSEVDRLLMDEGAINMIYQLERSNNNFDVPELILKADKNSLISISKEKRTLESKAQIIKQAVMSQSNDDSSIKVFRVRRESKTAASLAEANNAQKIAGLRSSMQSPSLSEMSAAGIGGNESKIIRRHSSSSFSSGGLSPRPQSPVFESSMRGGRKKLTSNTTFLNESLLENDSGIQSSTPLLVGSSSVAKRKKKSLENARSATRLKKVKKTLILDNGVQLGVSSSVTLGKLSSFTQLTIDISDNVAHIVVKPTGNSEELYDLQVLSELTEAVKVSASTGAVLLTSAEGALCGGLDLRGLLQPTLEQQRTNAQQLINSFSALMVALCSCRGAVVCAVGGACVGPGVALLTLCDLALASDRATFCVAPRPRRALPPEGAALLARPHALPPQVARELVMCGRKLTASEALQRGLVARTLWPDPFLEEVRSIALDLAQHPSQSFGVIKSVLRRGEVSSITVALRHESQQLVDLWCSPEGQSAIRDIHAHL